MKCEYCGSEEMMEFSDVAVCLKCVGQVRAGKCKVDPLLLRAYMYLNDGEFLKADEYSERVLDADPTNAYAYLCKLMFKLHLRNVFEFSTLTRAFKEEPYFEKAYFFGDEKLKHKLIFWHDSMEQNAAKVRYDRAIAIIKNATTAEEIDNAVYWLETVLSYEPDHADAKKMLAACKAFRLRLDQAEELYQKTLLLIEENTPQALEQAVGQLEQVRKLAGNYKDSAAYLEQCSEKINVHHAIEQKYAGAVLLMGPSATVEELNEAFELLVSVEREHPNYRNAESKIKECCERRNALREKENRLSTLYDKALSLMAENADEKQLNEAFAVLTKIAKEESAYRDIEDRIKECCERRNALKQRSELPQESETDRLCEQAIEYIANSGTETVSIAFLQRRLHIEYTKAAQLIQEFEKRGIVGPENGIFPRKVLKEKSNKTSALPKSETVTVTGSAENYQLEERYRKGVSLMRPEATADDLKFAAMVFKAILAEEPAYPCDLKPLIGECDRRYRELTEPKNKKMSGLFGKHK